MFTLFGAISWVVKLVHLNANPLCLQDGWQVITQAIIECQIEARGPGHPCSCPATPQLFSFYWTDDSSPEERFHCANEHVEELAPVH